MCKSPLRQEAWKPAWITQGYTPAFVGSEVVKTFGKLNKYFWGNVPAIDVVQLGANEGELYDGDLHLLFAVCGDLRNVIKSIVTLPDYEEQRILVAINDIDLDIIARNVIVLLLMLTADDGAEALDCILHLWYSVLITSKHLEILVTRVKPLIEDVVGKIANKGSNSVQAKTWTFGRRSLRLVLPKEQWTKMLAYFHVPDGLDAQHALSLRTQVTLAPERIDYLHRSWMLKQPSDRLSAEHFRRDGILLPVSRSRADFTVPNPTFFSELAWPMMDSADPIQGWPIQEVLETPVGPAVNDLYGRLYYYVRELLCRLHQRLSVGNCHFQLFNVNASSLPDFVSHLTFDRIEVSNVTDDSYLGTARTLYFLAPLLRPVEINAHATLIGLYLNTVTEMSAKSESSNELRQAMRYMGMPTDFSPHAQSVLVYKTTAALDQVQDGDKYFNQYMKELRFQEMARKLSLVIKDRHTIIDKWPLRLTLGPDDEGGKEAFEALLASGHSGMERYVEWKRTS